MGVTATAGRAVGGVHTSRDPAKLGLTPTVSHNKNKTRDFGCDLGVALLLDSSSGIQSKFWGTHIWKPSIPKLAQTAQGGRERLRSALAAVMWRGIASVGVVLGNSVSSIAFAADYSVLNQVCM